LNENTSNSINDTKKFQGNSYISQHHLIATLVKETESKTLLDYGCGKARQYTVDKLHEEWGFMPTLYDPAIPEYENLPEGPFDGIYSTDVMEHIPREIIPSIFEYIYSNAQKNAHCTVEPMDWWIEMINSHAPRSVYTHVHTYGLDNNYMILNWS
jgi:hypothetical protein